MPKHIYAAAFANEFIEDKTALLNALGNICDTFEPMMYSGDESPVVIDSILEDELSFNSAQVILDKTVHDDGETYFLLFSSNPSYAGMFLGSLDFLKKQKGLDKKYFADDNWNAENMKKAVAKAVSPENERDMTVEVSENSDYITLKFKLDGFTALMLSADK